MALSMRHVLTLAVISSALLCTVLAQQTTNFTTNPDFEFEPLKRSDFLWAKAMLKWLITNRTENGTMTFNAGFIRLLFHDCVGGCDGCVNLLNPSNNGLGFYKLPLDLMYQDFIFPIMSRADWYALAGLTAVELACDLTPCDRTLDSRGKARSLCRPHLMFLWGRRDCRTERFQFRFIPGPNLDPRFTIRNVFRLNFAEITALMGAHSLGKNHARDARWVEDGTKFNNQYYKDMLNNQTNWKRTPNRTSEWVNPKSGHVMLSSDMFMAFDVSNPNCTENPAANCSSTNTRQLVRMFAEDNDFWLFEFGVAFNVMINNGNFGRLRELELDTLDTEFKGDPFTRTRASTTTTEEPVTQTFEITTKSTTTTTEKTTTTTEQTVAAPTNSSSGSPVGFTASNSSNTSKKTEDIGFRFEALARLRNKLGNN